MGSPDHASEDAAAEWEDLAEKHASEDLPQTEGASMTGTDSSRGEVITDAGDSEEDKDPPVLEEEREDLAEALADVERHVTEHDTPTEDIADSTPEADSVAESLDVSPETESPEAESPSPDVSPDVTSDPVSVPPVRTEPEASHTSAPAQPLSDVEPYRPRVEAWRAAEETAQAEKASAEVSEVLEPDQQEAPVVVETPREIPEAPEPPALSEEPHNEALHQDEAEAVPSAHVHVHEEEAADPELVVPALESLPVPNPETAEFPIPDPELLAPTASPFAPPTEQTLPSMDPEPPVAESSTPADSAPPTTSPVPVIPPPQPVANSWLDGGSRVAHSAPETPDLEIPAPSAEDIKVPSPAPVAEEAPIDTPPPVPAAEDAPAPADIPPPPIPQSEDAPVDIPLPPEMEPSQEQADQGDGEIPQSPVATETAEPSVSPSEWSLDDLLGGEPQK